MRPRHKAAEYLGNPRISVRLGAASMRPRHKAAEYRLLKPDAIRSQHRLQ